MKQIKYIILLIILSFSFTSLVNATQIDDIKTSINAKIDDIKTNSSIKTEDAFNFFSDNYLTTLPKSYKYINLNFKDVKKGTDLYESLQKLVYIDLIENKATKINPKKNINAYTFYFLREKVLYEPIIDDAEINSLKNTNTTLLDLLVVKELIKEQEDNTVSDWTWTAEQELSQAAIFDDVYNTITSSHYNKDTISTTNMMYKAIGWLADGTDDKFTTYFPPVEKKEFSDSLAGQYEWIWAYIEMSQPWILKIIAPISGSPSESAWLKANDIVVKIDDFILTKDTTLEEAVSKIKWVSWTKVKLSIKRWVENLVIEVTRSKITLKDVEWKALSNTTYYMNMRMFWDNVVSDFKTTLEDLKKQSNTQKLIIDLRNNPGWYLDAVSEILSYFVPAWENVAVVKYPNYTENYKSKGYTTYDFSKLKIIILINEWSASASEIMAWTLKDYFPDITLVWEKSYGKWSVQTIKTYYDWSSLKYTIAHWFTGKTENWINWTWIKPDKEVKLDEEKKKQWIDNQLETAKDL